MTKFLSVDGIMINVDQIHLIEEGGIEEGFLEEGSVEEICTLTLLTGRHIRVRRSFDQLLRDLGEVVAASAGYMVLHYYADADEVVRLPVVAWRVAGNIATPIAPNDEAAMWCGIYFTILMPDGRVVEQYGATWANEAAWRASKDRASVEEPPDGTTPRGRRTLSIVKRP